MLNSLFDKPPKPHGQNRSIVDELKKYDVSSFSSTDNELLAKHGPLLFFGLDFGFMVWILGFLRTQPKPKYQLFLGPSDCTRYQIQPENISKVFRTKNKVFWAFKYTKKKFFSFDLFGTL